MLKNYIKVAFRNLVRQKGYAILNVTGLAVGFASVILIGLYVADEISFDRFHPKADRTYRIVQQIRLEDGSLVHAPAEGGLSEVVLQDIPEVETIVRRMMSRPEIRIGNAERGITTSVCLTDSTFFDVFDFRLVAGDKATALRQPAGMVVTERAAKALFGNESALGKTIEIEHRYFGGVWTVTGVLEDLPGNATMRFDFLTADVQMDRAQWQFSSAWWGGYNSFRNLTTYVTLVPGASAEAVAEQLADRIVALGAREFRERNRFLLQPLPDVHLHTAADYGPLKTSEGSVHEDGSARLVFLFTCVAALVLFLACVNYVNLSTARAQSRSREVGLRKVVGARRIELIAQFLGESLLQTAAASILALVLTMLTLGGFNELTGKSLSIAAMGAAGWAIFAVGTILVGAAAGFYPAFILSGFRPTSIVGGSSSSGKRFKLRHVLVIGQFAICITLVVVTLVVIRQMLFIASQDLGFQHDAIILLPLHEHSQAKARDGILAGLPLLESFKSSVNNHPDVLSTGACMYFLRARETFDIPFEGQNYQVELMGADSDFGETMQLETVQGRMFRDSPLAQDSSGNFVREREIEVVLNESAQRLLGGNMVGRILGGWNWGPARMLVVGVVRDFNDRSLREEVRPMVIVPGLKLSYVAVRLKGGNLANAMEHLETTWREFVPEHPFDYRFASDLVAARYQSEIHMRTIAQYASLLAMFVSAMGILGLAAYTASQRTKEIGVRKVLGASGFSIFSLLTGEYLKLVAAANLIAWPCAWFFARHWLDGFVYRIDLGIAPFLAGTGLTLGVAALTVCYQSLSAARTQPVDALRHQ